MFCVFACVLCYQVHPSRSLYKRGGSDLIVTELDNNVPPSINFGILKDAIRFEKDHGWHDFLMPVSDVMAAVSMLIGGDAGDFMVLQSQLPSKRWIYMSPEAFRYLIENDFRIVEKSIDMSHVDVLSEYWSILAQLGRDRNGRRKSA